MTEVIASVIIDGMPSASSTGARPRLERGKSNGAPPPPAFAEKLVGEALLLQALGYLGDDGSVRCPECGLVVPRSDGWRLELVCSCGWRIEDVDDGRV